MFKSGKIRVIYLGLCLLACQAAYAQLDPSLLGWWTLDDGSGTRAADSSGNGQEGLLAGGPQWTDGQLGGALHFDGVDDYVNLPIDTVLGAQTNVSVSAWVNYQGQLGGFWQRVFDFGQDEAIYMFLCPRGQVASGEEPIIYGLGQAGWQDEDRIECVDTYPEGLPEGWHHVAVTVDYENRVARIYVDAEVAGENDAIRYGPENLGITGQNWLGRSQYEGDPYFEGTLDDVRIYDFSMSQSDVTVVMKGGSLIFNHASRPRPSEGQQEVARTAQFSWKKGLYGARRNIYLGTDFNDVNEASLADQRGVLAAENHTGVTFDPGLLEYGQTYYWRVDEVNATPDDTTFRGDVWSFTVRNFVTVENFERYDDTEPNRIFDTWGDGWDNNLNGAQVGYYPIDIEAGEHYLDTSIIVEGKYSMPYFYNTDMQYSEAWLPLSDDQSNWTRDGVSTLSLWYIGYRPYMGGFVEDPAGTYTVTGAGTDLYGPADEFHFAYKELTGAVSITAKVDSVEAVHPFTRAGVMIRDTLEAGSRNVGLFITPENGWRFQYRLNPDEETERDFDANVVAPYWVRLQRTAGGLVRAYHSPDGSTWTRLPIKQLTVVDAMYVGLAVGSHDADVPADGVFSNVEITGTGSDAPWQHQDVGIISNAPEPMYVALNDVAVYYTTDDPNAPASATTHHDWTQWEIPLQAFADQGVDLANVEKMTLGVGAQGDASTPGGTGTLYFDKIRLYRPPVEQ